MLIGRLHGVPTPVDETLCRVADDLATRGRPTGSMTVGELTDLVDAAPQARPR